MRKKEVCSISVAKEMSVLWGEVAEFTHVVLSHLLIMRYIS